MVSSGFSVGNKGYGGFKARTTIMAIIGGTTSVISGGKFSNGAVTGAFIMMFNDLLANAKKQVSDAKEKRINLTVINDGSGKNGYYAVSSEYAALNNAGFDSSYVNQTSADCLDSFACAVIRGGYNGFDQGKDIGNVVDIKVNVYDMFKSVGGIVGVGYGIMKGAKDYFEYQEKIKNANN